ncbi:DUF1775 domain-containing protein [Micromonospora sp. NBC_01699]|uniref:DUF1775 domain-containing protein n=1 Tax=Micromonospora sp. NBC_01699 TaxID=2975984 RepID=UPI002E2AC75F|nr:DUF1775 domain-containing protein [Micromonospora sp. NBC_01699]
MRVSHLRRAVIVGAVTGATVGMLAAPAWAHVEVSADNPQAGARDVTVTFDGEAESTRSGIVSERVILPAGIRPEDVRLAKAPPGWKLVPAADGYTVAGKALPVGENAVHSIVITHLPADATQLAFKTIETYGDGKVSRWIGVSAAGQPEPDNPAPVLKLKPAAQPAPTSAAPTSAAATPTQDSAPPTASADTSPTPTAAAGQDDGPPVGLWIALASVVVIAAAAVGLVMYRRRTGRMRT